MGGGIKACKKRLEKRGNFMKKNKKAIALLLSITILLFNLVIGEGKVYALSNNDWEYLINDDDSITITKYLGNAKTVIVPKSIEGKNVTRIEGNDYSSIKNILFPSTIELIDQSIFYRGLIENIDVDPENNYYKSVDGVLFTKNMEKLISYPMGNDRGVYQIPSDVKIIAFNAFATTIYNGSTELKDIDIPSSVISIEDIHSLAARIANINIDPENNNYKSIDGVLFNKSGEILLCYPYVNSRTEYTIPEGTKEISRNGFYGTYGIDHSLTTLRLPASLEVFPAGFKVDQLQKFEVDPNNTNLSSVEGVLFNENMTTLISYPMGNSRTSYVIPSGVTKIEFEAFYDTYLYPRDVLIDLTIPFSLVDVGDTLRQGWENIFVDENHPSMQSIDGVVFSKDGSKLLNYPRLKKKEIYKVPLGTQVINYSSFSSANYLKKLYIPESVVKIEPSSINWSDELSDVIIQNNQVEIGESNFYSHGKITIWGSEGSTSETYAKENYLTFRLLDEIINADLSGLTLSSGKLEPAFTGGTIAYSASVGNEIESITITPTATESSASIKVNSIEVPSGVASPKMYLQEGGNEIKVEVTALDGVTTKEYKLTVTRKKTTPIMEIPVGGGVPNQSSITVNNGLISTNRETVETNTQDVIDVINKETFVEVLKIGIETGKEDVSFPVTILTALTKKNNEAYIEVSTVDATYHLPVSLIDVTGVAKQLGVASEELKLNVRLDDIILADNSIYRELSKSIDFKLSLVEPNGKTTELNYFNKPVNRSIVASTELNPLTTVGMTVEPDGTVVYVPTFVSDNNKEANIYRNTNSVYTLIENQKTFKDIDNGANWAEAYIEKLASRYIVNGVNDESFKPTQTISRGEFAAILSRGLGLAAKDKSDNNFKDVSVNQGFNRNGEITAAVSAGLLMGYEDGTFRPYDEITRDQAAIMISRAIDYINSDLVKLDQTKKLSSFNDAKQISNTSRNHIEKVYQAGYLEGFTDNTFRPTSKANRAQMSKILYNFLKSIEYIN